MNLKNSERKAILQTCLDAFGREAQLVKLMEEMGELMAEIGRYMLYGDNETDLLTEIVDVEILLDQMHLIFNDTTLRLIDHEKLTRLKERLESNYYGEKCGH